MNTFRLRSSPLHRWWWRIDQPMFLALLVLMCFGGLVAITSSPTASSEYSVGSYHFAIKQAFFLAVALATMVVTSCLNEKGIRLVAPLLFVLALAGVGLTHFVGVAAKGAQRWLDMGLFSIQPSEFLRPAFVVLTALLLTPREVERRDVGFWVSLLLLILTAGLIVTQPDFGMVLMICAVWGSQILISGITMKRFLFLLVLGGLFLLGSFFLLPHVQTRLNNFLNPSSGDSYQVDRAWEALTSGGFLGRGIGDGVIKHSLPDAHTDFILAVIGEESGLLGCLALLTFYAIIVLRGFYVVLERNDRFTLLAGGGLMLMLALQILANVAVVVQLSPTTGIALPFISYGGSSALAMAVTLGFFLALVRKGQGRVKRK